MLFAHVLEIIVGGASKYTTIFRDFYEFHDLEDQHGFTPTIRATFREPTGDRGLLNMQVDAWAKQNGVTIEGTDPMATHFSYDAETRIAQLENRIEQMTALLRDWKYKEDIANVRAEMNDEAEEEAECKAHKQLATLQEIVRYAQEQKGCQHISEAMKEMDHGGPNGH